MSRCLTRFFTMMVASLLLYSCSNGEQKSAEDMASETALRCYEALYNNLPEVFLSERINVDEMPSSYHQELLEVYRQHVKEVNREHQGVKSIEASRATMDTTLNVMQVFLILNYGDTTKEEIVVPMVKRNGKWMMK